MYLLVLHHRWSFSFTRLRCSAVHREKDKWFAFYGTLVGKFICVQLQGDFVTSEKKWW